MTCACSVAAVLMFVGTGQVESAVEYELLEGSYIVDLRGTANRVSPLEGEFTLSEVILPSAYPTYKLEGIRWASPNAVTPSYIVAGEGEYVRKGEETGDPHSLVLDVGINVNSEVTVLKSGWVKRESPFPTIEITVTESEPGNSHLYEIHVIAEPKRSFLFSTEVDFHATSPAGIRFVSEGDLLRSNGTVYRTNAQLVQYLGIMPIAPDIGLDAIELTPASSTVLFSAEEDVFSESLGLLQDGDLLSAAGSIFYTNQQLTNAFVIMPIVPDVGLDAVCFSPDYKEMWFSIETQVFSEALGMTLRHGMVLSDAGYIVLNNRELLSRFEITSPTSRDLGLDALHVLPNGVVLFSTEVGFTDARYGAISDGDLLSSNGHVIRRNLDILAPFHPLERLANFGLDGIKVTEKAVMPTSISNTTK